MSEPTLRDRLLAPPASPAGDFTLASGVKVYLRRWTLADQMRAFAVSDDKDRPAQDRVAEYLRLILCDENNRPVFAEGEDVSGVTTTAAEVGRLVTAAVEANGLGAGVCGAGTVRPLAGRPAGG